MISLVLVISKARNHKKKLYLCIQFSIVFSAPLQLTSEYVVRTFIDRILEVEPFINATVDRRFNDALQEAKEADTLVASGIKTRFQLAKEKPLLGVPFTVKVLLTVKGKSAAIAMCLPKTNTLSIKIVFIKLISYTLFFII